MDILLMYYLPILVSSIISFTVLVKRIENRFILSIALIVSLVAPVFFLISSQPSSASYIRDDGVKVKITLPKGYR